MAQRTKAILSLVVVMAIWGSAFPITKAALAHVPPMTFALLRFAVALLVLLPFALTHHKRAASSISGAWGTIAAMGVCGVTLFYGVLNIGLSYATATQAAIIQSIIPVITAIIAVVVLKERPSGKRVTGIALSLAGVALVVLAGVPSGDARNPVLGSVLILGAVIAWAVYTILAKRVATADQLVITAYSSVIGTVLLVPLALFEQLGVRPTAPPLQAWVSIIYLGVFSSAVGHLLYSRSLVYLDASQAATFINLVPIVGVAVSVIFLGETVVGGQLLGGALALLGVWLTT
jgi:drug/metabolite transporter (DMT)-like permease